MMWLLFAALLVFARHADCGALRCPEGSSCTAEEESKAPPLPVPNNPSPREAECQPGSEWESNCHSCKCSEAGIAECLKQAACDKEVSADPIRCKPNTTVERDCNTCICLEGGLGLCTLKSCAKNDPELPSGEDCAPETSWRNKCNNCWCSSTGYGYCTLKGCINDPEPSRHCAPNTSWRKDCNICHCTSQGRPVCTLMKCRENTRPSLAEIYEDNSEHVQRSQPKGLTDIKVEKRATRCEPRAEFKSECNVCKCSADGRSFSCTQNECLEGDSVDSDVEVFQETDGPDHVERNSVCQPNTIFYVACNACQCNNQGTDFACTLKICPLPRDVEVFHEFRDMSPVVPMMGVSDAG
ncbi:hypothetical protein O3G_MSEX012103 [Manduca sexta]|uniref:Pacifastin domain-containing protein n=1 Tax=Manduca sexta TaxID=7130 RepID=A0A921ZMB3_MANSE|nr:hypothetical protein O3G_MSEX012103 [Manduca sexta]